MDRKEGQVGSSCFIAKDEHRFLKRGNDRNIEPLPHPAEQSRDRGTEKGKMGGKKRVVVFGLSIGGVGEKVLPVIAGKAVEGHKVRADSPVVGTEVKISVIILLEVFDFKLVERTAESPSREASAL